MEGSFGGKSLMPLQQGKQTKVSWEAGERNYRIKPLKRKDKSFSCPFHLYHSSCTTAYSDWYGLASKGRAEERPQHPGKWRAGCLPRCCTVMAQVVICIIPLTSVPRHNASPKRQRATVAIGAFGTHRQPVRCVRIRITGPGLGVNRTGKGCT